MVKPGAIVIDVGMNRNDAGKLCGDVDFAGVREVAGWITPVPGGVGPDDDRDAAGQHARGRRTTAGLNRRYRRACSRSSIRCCDTMSCRRSSDITPEHVAPALDELLRDAESALDRAGGPDVPAALRRAVGRARRRDRAPVARLGHGEPSEPGVRHARAARRVQREPAARHRVLHPPGRRRAAVRQVPGDRRRRRCARRAAPPRAEQRGARLRAGRRANCGARSASASCRSRISSPSARSTSRSMCWMRPIRLRSTSTRRAWPACPTTCAPRCAPTRRADGHDGHKLTLQAPR